KPSFFAAISANFHSSWNHGSSGCFTRKPILTGSAACAAGTPATIEVTAAAAIVRKILRFMTFVSCLIERSFGRVIYAMSDHARGQCAFRFEHRCAGLPHSNHNNLWSWVSVVIQGRAPAVDGEARRVDEGRLIGREKHRGH